MTYSVGMKTGLPFILFVFILKTVQSQTALTIYADVEKDDSIRNFVNILQVQLNRSKPFQITVNGKKAYKGAGIVYFKPFLRSPTCQSSHGFTIGRR